MGVAWGYGCGPWACPRLTPPPFPPPPPREAARGAARKAIGRPLPQDQGGALHLLAAAHRHPGGRGLGERVGGALEGVGVASGRGWAGLPPSPTHPHWGSPYTFSPAPLWAWPLKGCGLAEGGVATSRGGVVSGGGVASPKGAGLPSSPHYGVPHIPTPPPYLGPAPDHTPTWAWLTGRGLSRSGRGLSQNGRGLS